MMRVLMFFLPLLLAAHVQAQASYALIIGNDAYDDVPVLEKAVADAEAISQALTGQGYQTLTATDQDRRGMNRVISDFTARLQPGDNAVVFFAGHGVEIDGENYLLPTDIAAPASGESDFIKSESIALSNLLDRIRGTGARMSIVFVDACRNNPFETVSGRSIGGTRGLGRIIAPQGTFVVFSAGAGQLALDKLHDDDDNKNSVFTRALLPRLSEPGLELRALVADLRQDVRDMAQTVRHSQIPAYYDELLGDFYFTPAALAVPQPDVAAIDPMRADFDLARAVGTAEAWDTFLSAYADRNAELAYQLALQLREEVDAKVAEPTVRQSSPAEETTEDAPAMFLTAAPAPDSQEAPVQDPSPEPVAASRKEIIRETQTQLNALGCSAGGADGVVGPRTRRAFAAYIDGAGSDLTPDDLGSAAALAELRQATGTICQQAALQQTAGTAGYNLAGRWSFKANCALLINVTGNTSLSKRGGNFFAGRLTDSLGQTANTEIYVNGRELTGTDYFPGIVVTWRGKLAPDGRSFTASGSTGCSVYAWKTG